MPANSIFQLNSLFQNLESYGTYLKRKFRIQKDDLTVSKEDPQVDEKQMNGKYFFNFAHFSVLYVELQR